MVQANQKGTATRRGGGAVPADGRAKQNKRKSQDDAQPAAARKKQQRPALRAVQGPMIQETHEQAEHISATSAEDSSGSSKVSGALPGAARLGSRGAAGQEKQQATQAPLSQEAFEQLLGGHVDTPVTGTVDVCGTDVSLYKLYTMVVDSGGQEAVTGAKKWRTLAVALGIDRTRNDSSTRLKKAYTKYLASFEKAQGDTQGVPGPGPGAAPPKLQGGRPSAPLPQQAAGTCKEGAKAVPVGQGASNGGSSALNAQRTAVARHVVNMHTAPGRQHSAQAVQGEGQQEQEQADEVLLPLAGNKQPQQLLEDSAVPHPGPADARVHHHRGNGGGSEQQHEHQEGDAARDAVVHHDGHNTMDALPSDGDTQASPVHGHGTATRSKHVTGMPPGSVRHSQLPGLPGDALQAQDPHTSKLPSHQQCQAGSGDAFTVAGAGQAIASPPLSLDRARQQQHLDNNPAVDTTPSAIAGASSHSPHPRSPHTSPLTPSSAGPQFDQEQHLLANQRVLELPHGHDDPVSSSLGATSDASSDMPSSILNEDSGDTSSEELRLARKAAVYAAGTQGYSGHTTQSSTSGNRRSAKHAKGQTSSTSARQEGPQGQAGSNRQPIHEAAGRPGASPPQDTDIGPSQPGLPPGSPQEGRGARGQGRGRSRQEAMHQQQVRLDDMPGGQQGGVIVKGRVAQKGKGRLGYTAQEMMAGMETLAMVAAAVEDEPALMLPEYNDAVQGGVDGQAGAAPGGSSGAAPVLKKPATLPSSPACEGGYNDDDGAVVSREAAGEQGVVPLLLLPGSHLGGGHLDDEGAPDRARGRRGRGGHRRRTRAMPAAAPAAALGALPAHTATHGYGSLVGVLTAGASLRPGQRQVQGFCVSAGPTSAGCVAPCGCVYSFQLDEALPHHTVSQADEEVILPALSVLLERCQYHQDHIHPQPHRRQGAMRHEAGPHPPGHPQAGSAGGTSSVLHTLAPVPLPAGGGGVRGRPARAPGRRQDPGGAAAAGSREALGQGVPGRLLDAAPPQPQCQDVEQKLQALQAPQPARTAAQLFQEVACSRLRCLQPGTPMAELKTQARLLWGVMSADERQPFRLLADQEQTCHAAAVEAYNYKLSMLATSFKAEQLAGALAAVMDDLVTAPDTLSYSSLLQRAGCSHLGPRPQSRLTTDAAGTHGEDPPDETAMAVHSQAQLLEASQAIGMTDVPPPLPLPPQAALQSLP